MNEAPHAQRPLVVEFVGLPTSGKTTLSLRLAEELAQAGIRTADPVRETTVRNTSAQRFMAKLGVIAAHGLRRPGPLWRLTRRAVRIPQRGLRDRFRVTFNLAYVAAAQPSHGSPADVILLEQSSFQAIWSSAFSATRSWSTVNYEALLDDLPMPDIAVVVEVSPDVFRKRIVVPRRGLNRVARAGSPDAYEKAIACFHETAALLDEVAAARGVRVVRLRNETGADLEDNVTRLAVLVQQALVSHGHMRYRAAGTGMASDKSK